MSDGEHSFDDLDFEKPVVYTKPTAEEDFPIGPEELLQIDIVLPNLNKKVKHDLFNTLRNKAYEDPFAIAKEMSDAPTWYAYYGALSAEADAAMSEAEQEFDEWYSLAYEVAKDYLDAKYDKVTETLIKNTIPGLLRETAEWYISTGEFDTTKKEYTKECIELVSFKEAKEKKRNAERNANLMRTYAKAMQFKIGLLPSQMSLARSILENTEMNQFKKRPDGSVSSGEANIANKTKRS